MIVKYTISQTFGADRHGNIAFAPIACSEPRVMQIRITNPDEFRDDMWFNDHVGEVFDVRAIHDGIPKQYEVDTSRLVEDGRMARSSRGIAYVPVSFAEIVEAS